MEVLAGYLRGFAENGVRALVLVLLLHEPSAHDEGLETAITEDRKRAPCTRSICQ